MVYAVNHLIKPEMVKDWELLCNKRDPYSFIELKNKYAEAFRADFWSRQFILERLVDDFRIIYDQHQKELTHTFAALMTEAWESGMLDNLYINPIIVEVLEQLHWEEQHATIDVISDDELNKHCNVDMIVFHELERVSVIQIKKITDPKVMMIASQINYKIFQKSKDRIIEYIKNTLGTLTNGTVIEFKLVAYAGKTKDPSTWKRHVRTLFREVINENK